MALVVVVDLRPDAIVARTELIVWERDGRVQKVRVPDEGGGFDVVAALVREPMNTKALPTRRCYMLGKRRA